MPKFTKEKIKKQLLDDIKKLKSKKGFISAGLPLYNRLFGRDSLIVSWELLDVDSSVAKKTLDILSSLQGKKINKKREEEPGKILHEHQIGKKVHPKGYFPFPYYGSVDATPLFLVLFSLYFQKTRNRKFIKKHFLNIISALNWILNYGDRDGDLFLEYRRQNPKGLFHQGWKDDFSNHLKIDPPVAIVEAQGYQYLALIETAKIFLEFKEEKLQKNLLKRAQELKEKFNKYFWMKQKKYFALALDGKKKQRKAITSNPGHLLFAGICDKEKERLVVKRLFAKDMWTPFGIRTHSAKEPDFDAFSYHRGSIWPHDNWVIAQGLKKLGYKKEYQKIKSALLAAYKHLGYIPELYAVVDDKLVEIPRACWPQAWATGALLNFLNK
ncbi:MAG TPA: hypothetical protein ENI51_07400 [Candidatus Atribacteria bacterium]|nr:hypothetical protein [Candidatus Atribacteria bacterium]